MKASKLMILGVAFVAALGAGYIAKKLATPPPAPKSADVGPKQPAIALKDVLVVSADVPVGGVLGDQIRWQSWPADAVNEGFITKDGEPEAMEKFRNSVARYVLYSGEPVRPAKLIDGDKSFMSSVLPAGRRAVATQIAADTSAGGFILPNDYVDVIMTRRQQATAGTSEGFVTETILTNVRVLAIDQTIQEDEEGRKVKVGDTATLELSPQQAEIITVAQQMADRLTLALRPIADAQDPETSSGEYLVSGNGNRGTVRLIKSGEVSEVGARK
ncbi:MAG: Flp pilus assembly protein CpaB [Rhizobiaceae bacterium]